MATTEQVPPTAAPAMAPVLEKANQKESFRSLSWALALIAVCGLILYRHVLWRLILNWWDDPNYSHGFVMPIFAGFVIWKLRDQLRQIEIRPSWLGLPVCFAAMGLLVVGDLGAELFSSRLSILVLICGVTLLLLGWKHFRALGFAYSMLLLAIPIPAIVLNQITFPLQLTASQFATTLLSLVGVPVLRDGNVIQLPSTSLEVVEACSGIRSLISLIALAAIFGYLKNHRSWQRWLLALLAVPIAVVANSVRIMGTGLLAQYWDPDKAEGFFHMFEGWVIFVLSLGLLIVADKAITRLSMQKERST